MNKIVEHYYAISSDKIHATRIVLIADIHYYNKKDCFKLDTIMEHILKLKPDYIAIAGDLLDEAYVYDLEYVYQWVKNLSKYAKVVISIGNHDLFKDNKFSRKKFKVGMDKNFFEELKKISNVKILDDTSFVEKDICFLGLTLPLSYYYKFRESKELLIEYMNSVFPVVKNNKFNVLLCHTPLAIAKPEVLKKIRVHKNLDLILSGHTHGGITPEFLKPILKNRGLISPLRRFLFQYAYGHIKQDQIDIVISSGITKASHRNSFHKLDPFFAREITVIDINKNKTDKV